ncbi:uncharacterized protein LOC133188130 [Saccostrea echinata]|uniref:uncharacterized protein LOC133188130 n=1 Tax=Saccostrea echinata TaxID=191078 RepID=UPI002A830D1F|nr:uncharacterized protein LOC133188130 [Saccostrea echinata]
MLFEIKLRITMGYPAISGPKSRNDRIAIVGAGIGGVHMASLLKARGFKNVKIFEQRGEIGGKSYSRFYRGVWNEFGTIFLTDIYDQVAKLIERYTPSFRLVSKAESTVTVNDYEFTTWRELLIQNTGEKTPEAALRSLQDAVERYDRIHRCLFGNYSFELMPRPTPEVLHQIRGTVQDFLQRNDLMLLAPIFRTFLTTDGYGYINETAAIYGLVWIPPEVVKGVFTPENGFWILLGAFQLIVTEIARQNKLHIHLGANVKSIQRMPGPGGIHITYSTKGHPNINTEHFDFLILSPAMNSLLNIVDFNAKERNLFSRLRNAYFVLSLVESDIGRRGNDPQVYFNNDVEQPTYPIYAAYNFYQAKNNISNDDHRLGIRENGPDGRPQETVMYYQYGFENPWAKDIDFIIQSKLASTLKRFDKTNPRILEQIKWGYYFPRFPAKDADRGYLWDILDMQGKYNTWYIGSSVCFESMESVVEYNNLMMAISHL